MSTAFTGQAIATGFDRRYGVLKRLGASPLPRWALMAAKTLSVLVTEVLQIALLTVIALALGWSPQGNPLSVAALILLGTAAFSGLGLLMAGTLKAEMTLAAANLVFLLLLVGGGVIVPLEKFPDAVRSVLGLLPISALSDGLREVLQHGASLPWGDAAVLAGWAVLGLGAAARSSAGNEIPPLVAAMPRGWAPHMKPGADMVQRDAVLRLDDRWARVRSGAEHAEPTERARLLDELIGALRPFTDDPRCTALLGLRLADRAALRFAAGTAPAPSPRSRRGYAAPSGRPGTPRVRPLVRPRADQPRGLAVLAAQRRGPTAEAPTGPGRRRGTERHGTGGR